MYCPSTTNAHSTLEVIDIHEHNLTCPDLPAYPAQGAFAGGVTDKGLVACGGTANGAAISGCFLLSLASMVWEPVFSWPYAIKENTNFPTAARDEWSNHVGSDP